MEHGKPLAAAQVRAGGQRAHDRGRAGRRLGRRERRALSASSSSHADAPGRRRVAGAGGRVFATYDDGTRAPLGRRTTGVGPSRRSRAIRARSCARPSTRARAWPRRAAPTAPCAFATSRAGRRSPRSRFAAVTSPAGHDLSRVFALVVRQAAANASSPAARTCVSVSGTSRAGGSSAKRVPDARDARALARPGRWMMVGAKWLGRVCVPRPRPTTGAASGAAPFHDSHMNAAIRFSPDGDLALDGGLEGRDGPALEHGHDAAALRLRRAVRDPPRRRLQSGRRRA